MSKVVIILFHLEGKREEEEKVLENFRFSDDIYVKER